jgi:uncharacterized membrane protein YkoI
MIRMRHHYGTAAAVLVAGFLLSGSVAFAQTPPEPDSAPPPDPAPGFLANIPGDAQPQPPAPSAPQQPQIPGVSVTWTQARDAALAAVPGTVLEQKMDFELGRVAYKVEILPQGTNLKREVLIDASTGQVLTVPGVSLTWEQARDAALGAVPGTIIELKLDDDAGRATYKAEILPQGGGFKRELLIDASNGTVLSNWQDGWDHFGPRGR